MAMEVRGEGRETTVFSATAITSGATAVSDPISIEDRSYFGIWASVVSTGSAHIRLYFEQGPNNTLANFATPSSATDVVSDSGSGILIRSIQPVPMPYIRFKATALSTSDKAVTVSLTFFQQS